MSSSQTPTRQIPRIKKPHRLEEEGGNLNRGIPTRQMEMLTTPELKTSAMHEDFF